MASAAEQLAANFNWSTFAKAEDLHKRLWFTLAALVIFRLGAYLPLPGIDAILMRAVAERNESGILGLFDKFAGGALSHMAIFALGVMPYISASIIVQLMTAVVPQLEALKKEGESGRKKINQYTRYGTVLLALVQSFGISVGLEVMPGSPVIDPGFLFRLSSVLSLTGGTLFLMWLGEQITSRGVGNGISLIIFSGIVAGMPHAIAQLFELGRTHQLSPFMIFMISVIVIATLAFIVFMERAQRRISIQYPKRVVGNRQMGGDNTHMPLKLNTAGVIPPIFASALLMLPQTVAGFAANVNPDGVLAKMLVYLGYGRPLYVALFVALIVFFAFFYTSVVFNPTEKAEDLKKAGAIVPGYRPGLNTAQYLDYVLTRLTVVGALYLSAICALPILLINKYSIPLYLGGTSLLIVVSVAIDTVTQIQSHLLAHQYQGLIGRTRPKKGKWR
jgi:preprotein translocase subunit SecY